MSHFYVSEIRSQRVIASCPAQCVREEQISLIKHNLLAILKFLITAN